MSSQTATTAEAFSPTVPSRPLDREFWETVPCNLCGSTNSTVKYQGTTDQDTEKMLKSFRASGDFISEETLVECDDCRLIYTSPRLRSDVILSGYTDNEDPGYVSQAAGRIKTFERCLEVVAQYHPVGKILDIGAAAGFFLKVAKDRGWVTYGIEPSKYLTDFGNRNYGVNILNGTIEQAPDWNEKMDVVTLWDVLEHTLDPTDVLTRCNRFLKDDGIIVINYPNIGNWMAQLAGRKYWFIISVHLYYFVPETIEKLLNKTGFEVVKQSPHFQCLEFGYLISRLHAYLPQVSNLMAKVAKALKVEKMLIPYFAAQTRVIARKAKSL